MKTLSANMMKNNQMLALALATILACILIDEASAATPPADTGAPVLEQPA